MRAGKAAWIAIFGYELVCPRGEMLCEVLDPTIGKRPIVVRSVIFYTALHMANLLPTKFDLYHQVAVRFGRVLK